MNGRIYIEVWRPIHKPNRKKIRLFREQTDLRPEDPFVRLKSAKHGHLAPFRQAQLGLQLIRIRNPLVLDLKTQGEIPFGLQIGRHDLTRPFSGSERRRATRRDNDQREDNSDELGWLGHGSFVQSPPHTAASKTFVRKFVDSVLHAKHICLARLSPLPLQGRGQGEGSARSHLTDRKSPHLHPLRFTEKGRGEIATQSFRG